MEEYKISKQRLDAIADAINAKTGETGQLSPTEMVEKIESVTPAKEEQSKALTLGATAPSTVTPDSGKVLSSVPVSIDTSIIKAENIAKDVQILGVTGTHEGGGGGLPELPLPSTWSGTTFTLDKDYQISQPDPELEWYWELPEGYTIVIPQGITLTVQSSAMEFDLYGNLIVDGNFVSYSYIYSEGQTITSSSGLLQSGATCYLYDGGESIQFVGIDIIRLDLESYNVSATKCHNILIYGNASYCTFGAVDEPIDLISIAGALQVFTIYASEVVCSTVLIVDSVCYMTIYGTCHAAVDLYEVSNLILVNGSYFDGIIRVFDDYITPQLAEFIGYIEYYGPIGVGSSTKVKASIIKIDGTTETRTMSEYEYINTNTQTKEIRFEQL